MALGRRKREEEREVAESQLNASDLQLEEKELRDLTAWEAEQAQTLGRLGRLRRHLTRHWITYISIFLLGVGLSAFLFPRISNLFNNSIIRLRQKELQAVVDTLSEEEKEQKLRAAKEENERISRVGNRLVDFLNGRREQVHTNVYGTPEGDLFSMGLVAIPKIDCQISIFEGTTDNVLLHGAGHLYESSLPVGGPGTHTVLTAHSGLLGVDYFTRLDELKEGDYFFIQNLNETLAYRVRGKQVVLPDEVSSLGVIKQEDLATLVTCTPVGVNSHRLLVTGERVDFESVKALYDTYAEKHVAFDSFFGWLLAHPLWATLLGLLLLLLLALLLWLILRWRKKRRQATATGGPESEEGGRAFPSGGYWEAPQPEPLAPQGAALLAEQSVYGAAAPQPIYTSPSGSPAVFGGQPFYGSAVGSEMGLTTASMPVSAAGYGPVAAQGFAQTGDFAQAQGFAPVQGFAQAQTAAGFVASPQPAFGQRGQSLSWPASQYPASAVPSATMPTYAPGSTPSAAPSYSPAFARSSYPSPSYPAPFYPTPSTPSASPYASPQPTSEGTAWPSATAGAAGQVAGARGQAATTGTICSATAGTAWPSTAAVAQPAGIRQPNLQPPTGYRRPPVPQASQATSSPHENLRASLRQLYSPEAGKGQAEGGLR